MLRYLKSAHPKRKWPWQRVDEAIENRAKKSLTSLKSRLARAIDEIEKFAFSPLVSLKSINTATNGSERNWSQAIHDVEENAYNMISSNPNHNGGYLILRTVTVPWTLSTLYRRCSVFGENC